MLSNNKKIAISASLSLVLSALLFGVIFKQSIANQTPLINNDLQQEQDTNLNNDKYYFHNKHKSYGNNYRHSSKNRLTSNEVWLQIPDFKLRTKNNPFYNSFLDELETLTKDFINDDQEFSKLQELSEKYPEQTDDFVNFIHNHPIPAR
jgi:hypothetical protein